MLKKFLPTFGASLGACALLLSLPAGADDIDIFTGASAGKKINPNVLIVLDNTSNWSRANQQWPGAGSGKDQEKQGRSEVAAIISAIGKLDGTVNVGLMEFVSDGNATEDGGYIRQAITAMEPAAANSFTKKLQTIYANYDDPIEKRNANTPYGNLMYDIYNYLSGGNSVSPGGVPSSLADANGYTQLYQTFKAPLDKDNTCANTVVVFISNPNASGPKADSDANTSTLETLSGVTSRVQLSGFKTEIQTTETRVGQTAACYADAASASAAELSSFASKCTSTDFTNGCVIGSALNEGATCTAGKSVYAVLGINKFENNVETGTLENEVTRHNADEWARFMHDKGIPVKDADGSTLSIRPSVTFYTIDVYNKMQNAEHTKLMLSIAREGGGNYYAARSPQALRDALDHIMGQIQAVNSTFASTSLPVNATNRSQNENQVFIGMFRPDPKAKPRWFGNLKRYQLIQSGGNVDLAGTDTTRKATDTKTGFVEDCATSFWTVDSGTYWKDVTMDPSPASRCGLLVKDPVADADKVWSDVPDGPQVEKGAVAQVLRRGNVSKDTAATHLVNRTLYTRDPLTGTQFKTFASPITGLSTELVNFIRGQDTEGEKYTTDADKVKVRPSVHGDVIHSRPLPINYGTDGVVVYYGANDGFFRAVNAATGQERWAFIAPEFYTRLQRLKDQTPVVNYPKVAGDGDVAATGDPKDYFFDGSTGIFQNADNSKIWIYPTMRRGGRMVYAMNVTRINEPSLMWAVGCPNLTNDTDCTEGMSGIGQTWSTPTAATVKGYEEGKKPILAFGGGYDKCEDENRGAPTCTGGKGGYVYILDAETGALKASFATDRSVAADVSMVDIDNDGNVDYIYAADTGGNIYRVDLIDGPTSKLPLTKDNWRMYKVGYSSTATQPRKFLFAPALLYSKGFVYVAIGSGDREHPLGWQYPSTAPVQNRFYVTLDDLSVKDSTRARDMNALADYSLTSVATCEAPKALPTGDVRGWFMDLAAGEQVVTSAVLVAGTAIFSTNRPITDATASCQTSLGEARGYIVSLFNASGAIGVDGICGGRRSTKYEGGGLPPSPVLATGVLVGDKRVSVVIGSPPKDGSAAVPIAPQKVKPNIKSTRKRTYTYVKGQ